MVIKILNKAIHPNQSGRTPHDPSMIEKYKKSHTQELDELRFNHYNINNTQIKWMQNKFTYGKDKSMKKFKKYFITILKNLINQII